MMKKRTSAKTKKSTNAKKKYESKRTMEYRNGKKDKKKKMSLGKKIVLNTILIFIIIGIISVSAFFAYIVTNAPKFDPNNLKFTQMSEIYDADGNLIVKMGNENRTEITYDELPEILVDAIVATEDSKFFQHNGFDLARFAKASLGQVMRKNSGGASTLTMQIVKNNYTSTVSSGWEGIVRKFTDIYLSIFKVEKKYTKKEIIEFYVNDSYLGNSAYGVEQASLNYFGKNASDLNLAEASFIAGLFQSPTYYNPYYYPERAEERRKTVLYLMKRHGYITEEEEKAALSVPITSLVKAKQAEIIDTEYQGYIDTVVEELEKKYNLNPYTTPLKIYTAMKKSKQDFVNKVMRGEAWNWENDSVQAGVVMTDSATGEVLAVGAGRNKNSERSYNYATMSNRQIGSTAKPIFDYGPAVEYLGWGTVNYIKDEPHNYSNGTKMTNSDGGYKGILPMYQALGLSRNITALKAFQQVSKEAGNDKILEFATRLGLSPEVYNGSIHEAHSIGSFNAPNDAKTKNNPMTMAGAYGAFSNNGVYIEPHTIKKFIYKETDEVYNPKVGEGANFDIEKHVAMSDSTAYIISYALNWSATGGLAKTAAGINGVSVAAKTGTSNFDDATIRNKGLSRNAVYDLWVCGYTPSQTITFWYGYDQIDSSHHNTTATWTIRDNFYRNLAENLYDKTGAKFNAPASIKTVSVVRNSIPLRLASQYTPDSMKAVGYFRKGTEPKEVSNEYNKLPSVTGISHKLNGKAVTLSWNGVGAEDLLNINQENSYGSLGYDIYVKNGAGGSEVYIGSTKTTSFTHTPSVNNPVYVIYTAFSNYKANQSGGVSYSINMGPSSSADLDVKIGDETYYVGSTFNDSSPRIIVFYNSVDVTDNCNIQKISGQVDTSVAGTYKLEYKITYSGISKTVSRTVTVKEAQNTDTPSQ